MKRIVCSIIIILMFTTLLPLTVMPQNNSSFVRQTNQTTSAIGYFENITNVSIEKIIDGWGITVVLRNTGGVPLKNLTVTAIKINGTFVLFNTRPHLIPNLEINSSTDIHFSILGIGLGKLTPIPEIIISVETTGGIRKEARILTKVFGTCTKILSTYFINDAFNGYTLFSPEYSTKTFLINKKGDIIHTWGSDNIQGLGLLLLETGGLLRTVIPYTNTVFIAGGTTGGVELYDWNGTIQWQYNYSNAQHCLHHSIDMLPNGHILMIGWEYKTAEEAIAAGRNPNNLPAGELWPDHVIEVKRTGLSEGTIVWEWHIWDHLIQDFDASKENYGIVAQHPELLDINYGDVVGKELADWNHINSIDYNEQFDQILLCARNQHEIWVIDHSTTTEEAAGHVGGRSGKGGDLLYRYGNPETYQMGNSSNKRFFGQHDAQWIPTGYPGNGHILVFNNGAGRPQGQYSSVEEFIPPVDANGSYYREQDSAYGPQDPIWVYTAENPFDFFAGYLSSAQRLLNGNTLLCDGDHGIFIEVTLEKKIVWTYHNLIPTPLTNQVFKAICYTPDYPGLQYLTH